MKLHQLIAIVTKSGKRLGRGYGSGKGSHTVGRGNKGHLARVGKPTPLWFEGGQLPLTKRMPYLRGKGRLKSLSGSSTPITLDRIEKLGLKEISLSSLQKSGAIRKGDLVKIVGTGTIKTPVVVKQIAITESARAKIEQAGGTIE